MKRLVRMLLHVLCLPLRPCAPRVLLYHSIDATGSPISLDAAAFAAQMAWLAARGYATWPASVYVTALAQGDPLPERLVVLTFDDGYRNNIELALPILERHGFVASVFLVTGNAGAAPRWPQRDLPAIRALLERVYPHVAAAGRERLLADVLTCLDAEIASFAAWRAASRRGFEVLSHGHAHRFLDQCSAEELEADLRLAQTELQREGLAGGDVLAWPYGASDARAAAAAAAAGVRAAFRAEFAWSRRHNRDLMQLNRVPIDPALGLFGLRFALGKGYELWQWLRAWRRG